MGQPGPLLPPHAHEFVPRASLPAERGFAGGGPRPRPAPPRLALLLPCTASDPLPLPTVHGIKWTCSNGNSSSGFSVEQLVQQILDSHQTKPQPRTHNCLCTGGLGERGPRVGRQVPGAQGALPGSRQGSPQGSP